jgi:hypothetical protein
MRGTWQTTDGGGSGLGTAVLVILAVALLGPAVAAAATAVAAAVAELVHIVLIAVAVLLGLGAAGLVALVAFRVSRGRHEAARVLYRVTPAPPRPSRALPEPRPAIEAPGQLHLHFHGVEAEDVAAIIQEQRERNRN